MANSNDQHMYSWYGTPLHIPLSEKNADAYNRWIVNFENAQVAHLERTGKRWDFKEPLRMLKDDEATEAHNKIGDLFNLLIELCGGSIGIAEFMEDAMEDAPEGLIRID